MSASNLGAPQRDAIDYVERNRQAVADLNDAIFYFAEPGMQEVRTSKLMADLLTEAGFSVETGISGFETGFLATYGSGKPVVAMHTEYDANPNNSQVPGVPERKEIIAGAPGHCEGHNTNAAVLIAAARAVKNAMDEHGLAGTLKVFGAPAEELLLPRPYYVRDGYFDDVDVAFHDHIWGDFSTDYGQFMIAAVSAEFIFRGETAHAGLTPWKGRDALDAVVLMDMGLAQLREHLEPTTRLHRAITDGGVQPNVIPDRASVWWYFRDPDADKARALFEQARRIAEGAALMTNTELEVEIKSAVWPVRANQTLAEVVQRNIEIVGMPEWTEDEQTLARDTQTAAGVEASGLAPQATPLTGPADMIFGSNDCGDISWKVPMVRLWFPGNIPNVAYHHWSAGVALTTSIAHKGAVAGAKALAASVLDCFTDPTLVERAKVKHAKETAGVEYRSLLPDGQTPPMNVNADLMARYRPALANHDLGKRVEFE